MQKLTVRLENCYGIGELVYEFDFSKSPFAYSIYAPNGFMKTSFLRTMADRSSGAEPKDRHFPRDSKAELLLEDGTELPPELVYAVPPFEETLKTAPSSRLLVNEKVKARYEAAVLKAGESKEELVKRLRGASGLSGKTRTPETELQECFNGDSFYEVLEAIEDQVPASPDSRLGQLKYSRLFDADAMGLLQSGELTGQLEEYIATFNALVDQSPILSRQFNHYHAITVHGSLDKNGFFAANHSVRLHDGEEGRWVRSANELADAIKDERTRILSDTKLAKQFDAIEKKLSRSALRDFRDYLAENQDIIPLLADYRTLQQQLWLMMLSQEREAFVDCIDEYRKSKSVIADCIRAAESERTDWELVVDQFNRRFDVPFVVDIENRQDVILKDGCSPQVVFRFRDRDGEECEIKETDLHTTLSLGERRALHLLNVLFEVRVRSYQAHPTLLVFDDVADSFDYKNKYAIIEYLCELSVSDKFRVLMLTHNFDFHRTVSSRIPLDRSHRLLAAREGRLLTLQEEKYQRNTPFHHWKDNLGNPEFLVASIPFVRNLAEYCGCGSAYDELTGLLHLLDNSRLITVADLERLYSVILQDRSTIPYENKERPVIELILDTAEELASREGEHAELESKIVLSIATRLLAEEHMLKAIADPVWAADQNRNRTRQLTTRFRTEFGHCDQSALMERVALMTPEGIHLNAFMYEPILDMSPGELRELYSEVKVLVG